MITAPSVLWALALLALFLASPIGCSVPAADSALGISTPEVPAPACAEVDLEGLEPEKARFLPGEVVELLVDLRTTGEQLCSATVRLEVYQRGEVIQDAELSVPLVPEGEHASVVTWQAPEEDFQGYLAVISVGDDQALATGVDVSSTARRYPRYGYVSVFPPGQSDEETREIVRVLAQEFHLNMLQFYDWFWRHEDLIPGGPGEDTPNEWEDLFGRFNAASTLRAHIDAANAENSLAIAYVAMYAAREGYEQQSGVAPAWGLYETPAAERQVAIPFGGDRYLFLFDPSSEGWRDHIIGEYIEALRVFDFDGLQIDQFGPRPTLYRADGSPVELSDTFVPFLEAVDEAMTRAYPNRDLCIFNLVDGEVDGYAVEAVASTTACDILYSEIWFETETYEELRAYIEQLRRIGGRRAVVLAVYPQYGEEVGPYYQAELADELTGVAEDTDHPGFTGPGFVDEFESPGDAIIWRIDNEFDANTSFVFRYANATGSLATRTLFVDGERVGQVLFGSRGTWDAWSSDAWLQARLSAGEHEIRLAYTEDDQGAINLDRMTLGQFDESAVRLQNAVIFASGATPILIGDDVQALAHEYFPNRSKSLVPTLQDALRAQYSFITAHEELLFGPEVTPFEARLDRIEAMEPHRLIADGVDGIWTLLRSSPWGDVIHLVNLVGVDDPLWRDPAAVPATRRNVRLRYRVEDPEAVTSVLWATPDDSLGMFEALEFQRGEGFIELEVPRLEYWDMILVR